MPEPQILQRSLIIGFIGSALLWISDKQSSISWRNTFALGRQLFSSSTMLFSSKLLAKVIQRSFGNMFSRLNSSLLKYHKRSIGFPDTMDQRTLPKENTSKHGLTSSIRIPYAQPGIQSRLPTFSKVADILV